MTRDIDALIDRERRRQRATLARASGCAAVAAIASVSLLATSGWFITAAALAGAAGPVAAQAFNYLLPAAAIRLLAIARTAARYGERLMGHESALRALARIRPALFESIAAGDPRLALSMTTGETTARLIQDVQVVETHFVHMPAPWATGGALISGLTLSALAGWKPALSIALCLAVLLLSGSWLARRLRAPGHAVQRQSGILKELIAQTAASAAELRCYGQEAQAEARIDAASLRLADAQRAHSNAQHLLDGLHLGSTGVATAAAVLLAAPAGPALAALAALAAAMTLDAGGSLLRVYVHHGKLEQARDRLQDLMAGAPAAKEAHAPNGPPLAERPQIELTFPRPAVFAPGSRVALVGRSGSGKTTLIESLLGLRHAGPATLFVDHRDVADLPGAVLRRCFAWVPQDAVLLSGTVRDNLLLACPDADDAALWAVLGMAVLDERIRLLPHGLDSWIGENGDRLSGGERRRLALARALLGNSPWLLLDEPTEGLDSDTERRVVDRLLAHLDGTGRGMLVASHRPALVAVCDRILDWPMPGDQSLHPAPNAADLTLSA